MKEIDLQITIVEYLRLRGIYVHSVPNEAAGKIRRGSQYNRMQQMVRAGLKKGVADLIVWLPIGISYIEVKRPCEDQSPDQVEFQKECEQHGIPYHVARSVEDVKIIVDNAVGRGTIDIGGRNNE